MSGTFDSFDPEPSDHSGGVQPEVNPYDAQNAAPDFEIIEEPEALIISADIPNVSREDIRVDVSPHRVVISAIVRRAIDAFAGFFRRESQMPRFERSITLPSEVRPDLAEAHYNNGVLEVVLPKRVPGGIGVYRLPAE